MAYLTNQVTQGPNNVRVWNVTAASATVFDTVEAGITVANAGTDGVSITNHESRLGPVHVLTVRVTGGPVSWRARGGLQT